jgi:hypothetical protein
MFLTSDPRHSYSIMNRLLFLLLVPSLVSCVGNPGEQAVQAELKRLNIIALSPSQGDATKLREWERYGPGAVRSVRRKVSTGPTLVSASEATKDTSIASQSMNPEEYSTLNFAQSLTVYADRSGNFSAESLVSEAAKVAAKASNQTITRVDMTFGNVRMSEPLTMSQMKAKLAASGVKPRWDQKVVLAPVFVDSITYTFYHEKSGQQSVEIEVPETVKADASAKQLKVEDGKLETQKPTFIGFYPVK